MEVFAESNEEPIVMVSCKRGRGRHLIFDLSVVKICSVVTFSEESRSRIVVLAVSAATGPQPAMIIFNGLFAVGWQFLGFHRCWLVFACLGPSLYFANEFAPGEVTSGRYLSIEMP